MRFSRFFIDRPIFAAALSIVIFLAGAISIFTLPISEYPEVVPPSIVVRAVYPGANPRALAEAVAAPLEEQINGVENMLYLSSQATSDGVMTLTVTFRVGTDPDLAQVQVQNRVSQALPRLPEEVRQLGVTTVKSSPNITMVVHLVSPDNRYDMVYLRNYAVLQVKDVLARIPGVGEVVMFGAGDYAMRVWLDPNKVAARGLTASDIVAAIRDQNVQVAAGVVGGMPMDKPVDFTLTVNARGRLTTEEEFRAIVVKTGADGQITRLRRRGPGRARVRKLLAALVAGQQGRGRDGHLPGAGLERAEGVEHGPRRRWTSSRATSRRASSIRSSTTPPPTCVRGSPRSPRRCSRRSCWSSSWSCCSCRPGARRSSRWSRCHSG